MRLWTVHPQYLDAKGLVAAWREALLAQKVLSGGTRGYTRHPQLERFRGHAEPVKAIAAFLTGIAEEARRRDYAFDVSKIARCEFIAHVEETSGQLLYEWKHLKRKLRLRAPAIYRKFRSVTTPEPHPLFRVVPGEVRPWERITIVRGSSKMSHGRATIRRDRNSAETFSPPATRATRMPRSHGGR